MNSTIAKKVAIDLPKSKLLIRNKSIANHATKVYRVFIADKDLRVLKTLENHLSKFAQYQITTFSNGKKCISEQGKKADIVVLGDFFLDGESMNHLEILKELKIQNPRVQVIILSSQMEIELAVEYLKRGAVNYIVKSRIMQFSLEEAMDAIVESQGIKEEVNLLSNRIKRDKLLLRGYSLLMIALLFAVNYFFND